MNVPEDKKDESKTPESDEVRMTRKLTRKELRDLLVCPICKTAGALDPMTEVCRKCGSFQNEEGEWVVPEPKKESKTAAGEKVIPWYEREL